MFSYSIHTTSDIIIFISNYRASVCSQCIKYYVLCIIPLISYYYEGLCYSIHRHRTPAVVFVMFTTACIFYTVKMPKTENVCVLVSSLCTLQSFFESLSWLPPKLHVKPNWKPSLGT